MSTVSLVPTPAQAEQDRLRTDVARIKAHKDAVQCQDACNGSGLIRTLGREFFEALCADDPIAPGTDHRNCHPILYLMLDKLCDLAGLYHLSAWNPDFYRLAYDYCEKIGSGAVAIDSDEHRKMLRDYHEARVVAVRKYRMEREASGAYRNGDET